MKNNLILLAVLFTSSFFLSSCEEDDPDAINELIGTYVGAMNVDTPSFSNAQYTVVVTKISSSRVRITPSGSAGSTWEANLTDILGVYTCVSCVLNDQITFTSLGSGYELSYNYDDNNEQYVGVKQ